VTRSVRIFRGDITSHPADAVVNAANSSLLGGGGVDGAIHRAGGPQILAECRRLRATRFPAGLPPGECVETSAGRLPARWVIHTVGPVFSATEDRSHLLAACYRNSLALAGRLGAATVAFPAISAGAFGWPAARAAAVAVQAVLAAETVVREVHSFYTTTPTPRSLPSSRRPCADRPRRMREWRQAHGPRNPDGGITVAERVVSLGE
jgi:O-acetyl-ADP-ribose deacetylase (regulator of RNase III)